MSDADKDRVFQFVELAQLPERPLDQVYAAESLLSKYDVQFALESSPSMYRCVVCSD